MSTLFQSVNPGDIIEAGHVDQFISPIQSLESGKPWFGEDTGSLNSFEVELDPVPSAYVEGMLVHFKAASGVTGPATLNVNGLGAKSLLKEDGVTLASGDILADQMVAAVYDGAEFRILSPVMTSTPAPSLTENVLVYSAVAPEQTTATLTTLNLPNYNFDPAKTYLLEGKFSTTNNASVVRVELSDGPNTYSYPGAGTYFTRGGNYGELKFFKMLPNLSGVHSVAVKATYLSLAEIRILEVHDNLVYADLAPMNSSATFVTTNLANFTAVSGHTYLLTVTSGGYVSYSPSLSVYLDNGTPVGIPNSSPTTSAITGPAYYGTCECSTVLSGLSGSYQVATRGKYVGGISVRIFDIT